MLSNQQRQFHSFILLFARQSWQQSPASTSVRTLWRKQGLAKPDGVLAILCHGHRQFAKACHATRTWPTSKFAHCRVQKSLKLEATISIVLHTQSRERTRANQATSLPWTPWTPCIMLHDVNYRHSFWICDESPLDLYLLHVCYCTLPVGWYRNYLDVTDNQVLDGERGTRQAYRNASFPGWRQFPTCPMPSMCHLTSKSLVLKSHA